MVETVEVKIKLNKILYDALKWYVPQTIWGHGLPFEESLTPWINECLKQDLEAELGANCDLAADQITETLKEMIEPLLKS
jgi:hypothetical protein